ncbi:MAG TPA: hypothetical protein RMG48_21425 [Myxococcales bacterium LLY-WYZ-16_1]|nr:hypothetical protein [Myxococcales bacterium LLY-WYZ-16_1]
MSSSERVACKEDAIPIAFRLICGFGWLVATVSAVAGTIALDPTRVGGITVALCTFLFLVEARRRRLWPRFDSSSPWMWGLMGAAVLGRLIWWIMDDSVPVSDFRTYLELGRTWAEQGVFGLEGPSNHRPAGVPALIAGLIRLGLPPVSSFRLLNVGFVFATAWALFRCVRDGSGTAAVGWASAAAWLSLPSTVLGVSLLGTEFAFMALLAGYLWAATRIEAHGATWLVSVWGGLSIGLACHFRPEAQLLPPFVLGMSAVFRPSHRGRRALRHGLVVLVMVITLLPWAVRNSQAFDRFWLTSSAGGFAFFLANHPGATGSHVDALPADFVALDEVERNREGFERGLRWIRENPAAFLRLIPLKWYQVFRTQQAFVSGALVPSQRWRSLLVPAHGLTQVAYLVLLGLAGLAVWRGHISAALGIAVVTPWVLKLGMHVFFHGEPRYQVTVLPSLCLLAGLGWAGIGPGRRGDWLQAETSPVGVEREAGSVPCSQPSTAEK